MVVFTFPSAPSLRYLTTRNRPAWAITVAGQNARPGFPQATSVPTGKSSTGGLRG